MAKFGNKKFYQDWRLWAILTGIIAAMAGVVVGNVNEPVKGGAREIVSAHLSNLYVCESMREQGVGRQLFDMFKEYCRERGAKNLSVTVNSQNKIALDFYAAVGFAPSRIILSQDLSDA